MKILLYPMGSIIFSLPFKSRSVVSLTSIEFNLNPQQLPIQCTAVRAVPRFVLAVAPGNDQLIHLILNSHLFLCRYVPFTGCAFHKNSELSRRWISICDIADQSRTEREQLLGVEQCPGKSPAVRDNCAHRSQISDLTQLSCNHCNPSFIYTEFLGLKIIPLFQLRCNAGCISGVVVLKVYP